MRSLRMRGQSQSVTADGTAEMHLPYGADLRDDARSPRCK
jgi:hypothetical protein